MQWKPRSDLPCSGSRALTYHAVEAGPLVAPATVDDVRPVVASPLGRRLQQLLGVVDAVVARHQEALQAEHHLTSNMSSAY